MAGVFANIFGGAGPAGAGPAAPAPGVVTPAQIADITNVFAGVNWNADVAEFATNAATRSIQADVQATAGSTNTSQDSLFNVPRSGFIYLPYALIAEVNSFCSPVRNSHLAAGVAPFNAVTMAHGNSLTAYAFNLWPGCSITAEAFAEHASAMYTRAIALAYGDSAILFALLEAAKQGQYPHGPFVLPDIPKEAILRMSAARIFYVLMGWHGIPARLRSLEEAMTTLGLNDIGVDTSKLTPDLGKPWQMAKSLLLTVCTHCTDISRTSGAHKAARRPQPRTQVLMHLQLHAGSRLCWTYPTPRNPNQQLIAERKSVTRSFLQATSLGLLTRQPWYVFSYLDSEIQQLHSQWPTHMVGLQGLTQVSPSNHWQPDFLQRSVLTESWRNDLLQASSS